MREKRNKRGPWSYVYNGIDRVDSDGGYVTGNVVPCCWPCNRMKMDMVHADFLRHVGKIYGHSLVVGTDVPTGE